MDVSHFAYANRVILRVYSDYTLSIIGTIRSNSTDSHNWVEVWEGEDWPSWLRAIAENIEVGFSETPARFSFYQLGAFLVKLKTGLDAYLSGEDNEVKFQSK